jgi:hypothetical protein
VAQRRFHYEQAFEHYLRANRVPYIAVDEAKKALVPAGEAMSIEAASIKSFDFVVAAPGRSLLVDVKGRMLGRAGGSRGRGAGPPMRGRSERFQPSIRDALPGSGRGYESWTTLDDVEGLARWQELFGPGFEAVLVFIYCLRHQPPDALFDEIFEFASRWYAMREVRLDDYRSAMVRRSGRWGTVHLPAAAMRRLSRPFSIRPGARPIPCAVA